MRPRLALARQILGFDGRPHSYYARARLEPTFPADLVRLANQVQDRSRAPLSNEPAPGHRAIIANFGEYKAKSWSRAFQRIELHAQKLTIGIPIRSITVQVATDPLPTGGEGLGSTMEAT